MTRSRNLTLRVAATLVLVGLGGCSDDSGSATDPPPSSSTPTGTGSSSGDEAGHGTGEEPGEADSEASGEVVAYDQFSFTAPEGWKVGEEQLYVRSIESPPAARQVRRGEPFGYVTVSAGPAAERTLDQLARGEVADGEGRRVEDLDLAGETVFHVSRPDQAYETNEVFGTWRDGERISIRFSMIESTAERRQAVVESVLATWVWRK